MEQQVVQIGKRTLCFWLWQEVWIQCSDLTRSFHTYNWLKFLSGYITRDLCAQTVCAVVNGYLGEPLQALHLHVMVVTLFKCLHPLSHLMLLWLNNHAYTKHYASHCLLHARVFMSLQMKYTPAEHRFTRLTLSASNCIPVAAKCKGALCALVWGLISLTFLFLNSRHSTLHFVPNLC